MSLLSLESFRQEIGYHPFKFWGMANGTIAGLKDNSRCSPPLLQHAYQDADQCGRAEILREIERAEEDIKRYAGFHPAPRWTEATVNFPRYHDSAYWRGGSSLDNSGHWISVNLPDKHIQEVGVESATYLGFGTVAYTDDDGDGVKENWAVAFELTDTTLQARDLVVRVPENLWLDECEPLDIDPVTICISEGEGCASCNVADIRGKRWQMVVPQLYEGFAGSNAYLDPTTDANFITTVEIWKRVTSAGGTLTTNSQAKLIWETTPCPGFVCVSDPTNNGTDPATVGEAVARAGIRGDGRLGIVYPAQAVYNATSGIWSGASCLSTGRLPDRVTVRYRAGHPYDYDRNGNARMARKMRQMVTRLAIANLTWPFVDGCGTHEMNHEIYHWQFDLARIGGADREAYMTSGMTLDNPLGTRRGAVWVWAQIEREAVGNAVVA